MIGAEEKNQVSNRVEVATEDCRLVGRERLQWEGNEVNVWEIVLKRRKSKVITFSIYLKCRAINFVDGWSIKFVRGESSVDQRLLPVVCLLTAMGKNWTRASFWGKN